MRGLALAALMLVAACADETVSGYAEPGPWRLTELNGAPVGYAATLTFPRQGRVEGRLPCHDWRAQQTAPYPWFLLSHFELGQRPCAEPGIDEPVVHALASVTLAEVQGKVLILSDEGGAPMLVFRRD